MVSAMKALFNGKQPLKANCEGWAVILLYSGLKTECHVRPATSKDAAANSRVVLASLRESNAQGCPPGVLAKIERSFCF